MKNNVFIFLSLLILVSVFSGCTNNNESTLTKPSDSGGSEALLSKERKGQFGTAPVSGLRYTSPSFSGETDAQGSFQYMEGETLRFLVGDLVLGEAVGAVKHTPFDLAGIAIPENSLEIKRLGKDISASPWFRKDDAQAFDFAANIALFLQTLDEDADLSNGIQIPAKIHEITTEKQIDFNQNVSFFPYDHSFRNLIAQGKAANLWGGTRIIKTPGQALDALYANLGRVPEIDAVVDIELDEDGDGVFEQREHFAYDEQGAQIRYENDKENDGTADFRQTFIYDQNGKQIRFDRDSRASGMVDRFGIYTYDADGNRTSYEDYAGATGERIRFERFDYDALGNKILEEYFDGDGTFMGKITITYTYDAKGNPTRIDEDQGDDGTIEIWQTFVYDENGRKTLYAREGDSVNNVKESYAYDVVGNRIYLKSERSYNGKFLTTDETFYNAQGQEINYQQSHDGIVDLKTRSVYDEDGKLREYIVDKNGDGTENHLSRFLYDQNRNKIAVEHDLNMDGSIDNLDLFTYDENGNQTSIAYDAGADGSLERLQRFVYDARGNQVLYQIDRNGDGIIDLQQRQTYQTINRWLVILQSREVVPQFSFEGSNSVGLSSSFGENSPTATPFSFVIDTPFDPSVGFGQNAPTGTASSTTP